MIDWFKGLGGENLVLKSIIQGSLVMGTITLYGGFLSQLPDAVAMLVFLWSVMCGCIYSVLCVDRSIKRDEAERDAERQKH